MRPLFEYGERCAQSGRLWNTLNETMDTLAASAPAVLAAVGNVVNSSISDRGETHSDTSRHPIGDVNPIAGGGFVRNDSRHAAAQNAPSRKRNLASTLPSGGSLYVFTALWPGTYRLGDSGCKKGPPMPFVASRSPRKRTNWASRLEPALGFLQYSLRSITQNHMPSGLRTIRTYCRA
jgi:hypothetical protein